MSSLEEVVDVPKVTVMADVLPFVAAESDSTKVGKPIT
jgi:hypothetical protein